MPTIININDIESANKTIRNLKELNSSIDKYTKNLNSQTASMSSFWKDDKYKQVKNSFDDAARFLSTTKKKVDDLLGRMDMQLKEAKSILDVHIQ